MKTVLLLPIFLLLINLSINSQSKDLIYTNIDDIPEAKTAIILGAKVYDSGRMSDMLHDRVVTGVELYQNGKVEKLLISGDHGQKEYDEVNTIKEYLLSAGIPKEDIFLDHAGFDTYDSMYRAKEIFQIDSAIIVTQEFHLPRSVYIGKKLGLDVYGMVADKQPYLYMGRNNIRESIAKVKAFFNVLFNSKPTYLGEQIPITGDSSLSWD